MKLKAYYLNKYVDEESITLSPSNRSFLYGDGIFETIIIKNGHIRFWNYHNDRLHKALKVLEIDLSFLPNCKEIIYELIDINSFVNARVKLQVWRADGGLYEPLYNEPNVLITMKNWDVEKRTNIKKCSFSDSVYLNHSTTSPYKTCNSLPYIIAANERKKRSLEELIILDSRGNVAECCSSNIFWTDGIQYFTPSLKTGCVDGIMRRHVIAKAEMNGIKIIEGEFLKEDLIASKAVFCCNVTGVTPIVQIDTVSFNVYCDLIPLLEL